jgi:hypothetical protein
MYASTPRKNGTIRKATFFPFVWARRKYEAYAWCSRPKSDPLTQIHVFRVVCDWTVSVEISTGFLRDWHAGSSDKSSLYFNGLYERKYDQIWPNNLYTIILTVVSDRPSKKNFTEFHCDNTNNLVRHLGHLLQPGWPKLHYYSPSHMWLRTVQYFYCTLLQSELMMPLPFLVQYSCTVHFVLVTVLAGFLFHVVITVQYLYRGARKR